MIGLKINDKRTKFIEIDDEKDNKQVNFIIHK